MAVCVGVGLVIERSRVRFAAGAVQDSLNSAFHPCRVIKSSIGLLVGVKTGCVHLCLVAGNIVSHMAGDVMGFI